MHDLNRLAQRVVERSGALVLYARQWLDSSAAEDAVQEALVSLLAQRQSPLDVIAWMYRAVRNSAIDQARRSARRRRRERIVAEARSNWFDPSIDTLIDARAAEEALRQLPPETREIVVLRIWSGLTLVQIADITGAKVSTVHDRYKAALKQLRQIMETPCPMRTK